MKIVKILLNKVMKKHDFLNIIVLFFLLQIGCYNNQGNGKVDYYAKPSREVPVMGFAAGVRLFKYPLEARGLATDRQIFERIISKSAPIFDQIDSSHQMAKVNLFLELVVEGWQNHAVSNWLVVNQEFVQSPEYLKHIHVVLCKTRHCMKVMRNYRAEYQSNFKLHYIGFTSSVLPNSVDELNFDLALHAAGKSPHKNTRGVLDTWVKNPDFPNLLVTCTQACRSYHLGDENKFSGYKNIDINFNTINEKDFFGLTKNRGLYIVPSEIEGWGHYINEGRARGSIVVTSNAPPMNEMVTNGETGFLVPVQQHEIFNRFSKEHKYRFTNADLEGVIRHIIKLPLEEKRIIGLRAKQAFNHEQELFELRLESFLKLALKTLPREQPTFSNRSDRFTIVSWRVEPIAESMARSLREIGFDTTIEPAANINEHLDDLIYRSEHDAEVGQHFIIWWAWKVHGAGEADSLKRIISRTKKSKKIVNVMYNFDDPYCWQDSGFDMKSLSKLFDVVFPTSRQRLKDYQSNGAMARYLPPATDEETHYYDPDPLLTADVSMAITSFYDPTKYPTLVSRLKIARELCAEKSIKFSLYGFESLREEVPECYKGFADLEMSRKVFSSSKINIATHVIDAEGYMSDRIPFISMSKGLILMDPVEISRTLFKDGESCLVIDPTKSIVEQVKRILAMPMLERDRIRLNGHKIAVKKLSYSSWADTIVDTLGAR